MKTLGISLGHDTSFACIENGVVSGVIEVERYFRQKRYKLECSTLDSGKNISSFQYVDTNELRNFLKLVIDQWGCEYEFIGVQNQGRQGEFDNLKKILIDGGITYKSIANINHHLSHAASIFYTSPFRECLTLSYDGTGNDGYTVLFKCDENGIDYIEKYDRHFGQAYNNLGFILDVQPDVSGTSSGKTMGLTAYGTVRQDWLTYAKKYVREYKKLKPSHVDGLRNYGKGHTINSIGLNDIPELKKYLQAAPEVGGEDRKILKLDGVESKDSQDLAATVQHAWTAEVVELLKNHVDVSNQLCVVGGCALNGITNFEIQKTGMFQKTYFIPNPSDCGLAVGAGLFAWYSATRKKYQPPQRHLNPYLGLEAYDLEDLPKLQKLYPHQEIDSEILSSVLASTLKDGLLVGVVRGRCEIGPRALGNRSILCNPVRADAREVINKKVKHREWYRPFAPVALADKASNFFTNVSKIPYMEAICYTKEEFRETLPAITHVDGSARLQTIDAEDNPFLCEVLVEFEKLCGFPILLNTSFNPGGEPILNYCHVALGMLDDTDLDLVLIGNTFFSRKGHEHLIPSNQHSSRQ